MEEETGSCASSGGAIDAQPAPLSVYVPHALGGSGADLQLKPSFDCVGSTAACTHLSVTGVEQATASHCEQTWRRTNRTRRHPCDRARR